MELTLPPGNFAAYIFDCDGTLADTMPLHYRAWLETLGEQSYLLPENLYFSLGGMPTNKIVELLNARHGLALAPMEIAFRKEEAYLKLLPGAQPVAPVLAIARAGHERGLPMAVGSGGFKRVVLQTLDTLGITDWFQAVVTADEVARGKPAPDTYLEAARRLGVAPGECLVFEDTQLGLDAATAAGMASVFVPSGPAGSRREPPETARAIVGADAGR